MFLGMNSKNKKGASVHVDYHIHIHEIKPWPPSQSLRSLRSVLIQWENGERSSGSTNTVVPSIGSVIGEGKIEFNESFKLSAALLRDTSVRTKDKDTFLKNVLEFNLYETRREKTHQLLATAIIDLADYGVMRDTLSVSAPMNNKRSFRNTAQPFLYITIQLVDKRRTSSSTRNGGALSKEVSLETNGGESVSALMNEEYAEEAEFASFTDDDVSSHSSLTVSSSTLESNGGVPSRNEKEEQERADNNAKRNVEENSLHMKQGTSDIISQKETGEGQKESSSESSSVNFSSEFGSLMDTKVSKTDAYGASTVLEQETDTCTESNGHGDSVNEGHGMISNKKVLTEGNGKHHNEENTSKSSPFDTISSEAETNEHIREEVVDAKMGNLGLNGDIGRVDGLKNVKSVRSSSDITRSNIVAEDSRNLRINERKDAKVYPRDAKTTILEKKVQLLEGKIKMLEGELREAAATEAALYSVVAEHGSSASKVHSPARRLSRLYLHACRESPPLRRANAAKSAVSGLVLVAKACGNDVPRLTFWLSNSVMLRAIISQDNRETEQSVSAGRYKLNQSSERESKKKPSPLKWNESSLNKKDISCTIYERFGDWDDPITFLSALEKIEAWIFSRIVESIWWQTLTPHMQSVAVKSIDKIHDSGSKKHFGRNPSSVHQEQVNFSLVHWKKAFKDACERLCPLRAGGHECGCLPVLARSIMEQCVARLDVAMFNAILRDSSDAIPTDPVSDPIGDSKVLPIPAGKSSFGAGAQLKNAIGNWSRWLTDLFGIDDDDIVDDEGNPAEEERRDTSFKTFHLLNALSDLMMLPKDMLLDASIRKEVCPTFGPSTIKRVLDNFVPDEFCPDPIPKAVLEALESEEPDEAGEDSIMNYPLTAAPPIYSPPSTSFIASIIGEFGSQSQLRRSGTSVIRKSYTSDDELDELNSPLALTIMDTAKTSSVPTKPNWVAKANSHENAVRYELLRDVWMNCQ